MRQSKNAYLFACLLTLTLIFAGCTLTAAAQTTPSGSSEAKTTVYRYDPINERWVKSETSEKLPQNPDGTQPPGSNTVIIRIDGNEPVKEIIIFEALVIHGANEPLLEINGHDVGGSGKLRIGELQFAKVDAQRMEIKDTDVMRLNMANVVAKDTELDLDVNVVNVVRVGRGATSTLIIGAKRADLAQLSLLEIDKSMMLSAQETGGRIDRLRILGPSSGVGYVERILIVRSSVFGNIEVRNTAIQDLILRDVSLDGP
ncbi:MAG: hypothetical protein HYX79_09595 [Chloroflexi bacterium]|nr:hypothetical protein [Chloroflexota bacterium]